MALGQLIIILAFLALGWLVFIRPMRRRLVEQRELYASVTVGDEIVTQGGLLGFVRSIDEEDDTLVVEIAPMQEWPDAVGSEHPTRDMRRTLTRRVLVAAGHNGAGRALHAPAQFGQQARTR